MVKMRRKTHSKTLRIASLVVPVGSKGDCHAIVLQFARMVIKMNGSNHRCSTNRMADFRGSWPGNRQKIDVELYSRSLPRTRSTGGSSSSVSKPPVSLRGGMPCQNLCRRNIQRME